METKLVAIVIALFVASCGLNTEGLGETDEGTLPDVPGEDLFGDAEPDIFEADFETVEDEASEPDEAVSDEATPDEVAEDVMDIPDETEPEDAVGDEAADEAGDDGVTEDAGTEDGDAEEGEATDPCTLPEIPPTGLYLYFCIVDRWPTNLHLERWVDRSGTGLPDEPWAVEPGCAATGARSLFCEVNLTGPGTMIFGVHLTYAWACQHLVTPYAHGVPELFWNGTALTLGEPLWNGVDGSDGCQYTVSLPTP